MRDIHRDLEKMRFLLRQKITYSDFTQREVDLQCGWSPGSLSQLLQGRKALRVESVLQVLDVLGIEPGRFYAELYGSDGPANAYRFLDGAGK